MKRKTLIIRYEDMALNPMRYVRQVYRFLGEKFTPEIDKKMQDAIAPPKKSFTDSGNKVIFMFSRQTYKLYCTTLTLSVTYWTYGQKIMISQ